jgi:SAM-dependent methyltransferase
MKDKGHHELVVAQFGSQADAYLRSAVHAQGEDLDAIADGVRGASKARVLDLGCGGGHVSFRVAPHVARVVAYDLSPDMLATVASAARERDLTNIETVCGPVERLPFEDASFDRVLTRFSAHHWQDVDQALKEARRVLRPQGRATFVDVIAPAGAPLDTFLQAIELLRDPSHVRDYSLREWERLLDSAGFSIARTTTRRLRIEFASWIERMKTPPIHVEAIRSLYAYAPDGVRRYFEIEPDGSFTFDTGTFEASATGSAGG